MHVSMGEESETADGFFCSEHTCISRQERSDGRRVYMSTDRCYSSVEIQYKVLAYPG